MAKNRFEQVDERPEDAITLMLWKKEGASFGSVHVPALLSGGRIASDTISPSLSPVEAFRSAVRLANEMKAPIVVMDADKIWQTEWGELYRPIES